MRRAARSEETQVPSEPLLTAQSKLSALMARLGALERVVGVDTEGEQSGESPELAAFGEPVLNDAIARYQDTFMDYAQPDDVRIEALEMLGRFPDRLEPVSETVMKEALLRLQDPETDRGFGRRIVLFMRSHASPSTTDALVLALESQHLSASTRRAALIGLEGRSRTPALMSRLESLRGATGDADLERELDRVLAGLPMPKYEKGRK